MPVRGIAWNLVTRRAHGAGSGSRAGRPCPAEEHLYAEHAPPSDSHSKRDWCAFKGDHMDGRVPAFIGDSPAIIDIRKLISRVAPTEMTVLVTGESGTGKEEVARLIHRQSRRADAPFKAINCGAIPAELAESESFGHERGAFTGALSRRVGKVEEAEGGTLLLDEVAEMPPPVQVKLLRALEEREIERLGSNRSFKIDVRIVAATNRVLTEEVRAGRFRPDLYYRLQACELSVPPLRQRRP